MSESIERIVKGLSVLRVLGVATLLLLVACLILSASIALAHGPGGAEDSAAVDVYEFDFPIEAESAPNPEFDEAIIAREI